MSESAVRISRCQIDHNPICNIGALRGVKRVRESDGVRVMLNDKPIETQVIDNIISSITRME